MSDEINRFTWRYWLDGNGAWVNRWDGTGGDVFLLVVMAVGIIWMTGEYFWYARQLMWASRLLPDESHQKHLKQSMTVFLFCCLIHFFNLINWIWPVHMLWSFSYFVNAVFASRLNRGFGPAVQKSLSDSAAESRLHQIGDRLKSVVQDEQSPDSLRKLASDLRDIAGRLS
jgi:hypothetical protein